MITGMTPEAEAILAVFRKRNVRAAGLIHPTEFGDAIVWGELGCVRDEAVRQALASLFEQGLLRELLNAFELTELGEKHIYGDEPMKHGARIYRMGAKLLVKQTVLRGTPPEYVIDEHRERHIPDDDDAAIAAAVREAVDGRL
jgi:hypothetical protein